MSGPHKTLGPACEYVKHPDGSWQVRAHDIDLLVEFEDTARPSFFDMAEIEIELSQLLGGRKVDLRTAAELSRYFRDEVLRTAVVQYVAR